MKLHLWLGDVSFEVSRDGVDFEPQDEPGLGVGIEVGGIVLFALGAAVA